MPTPTIFIINIKFFKQKNASTFIFFNIIISALKT